ncbi:glycosyltransferase family 39 protein, partial [Candidatus Woesearchaeota archaeon]|nr:glycosyltransferase family 39 protein [Candidatus Woesearchaeota archaeon]
MDEELKIRKEKVLKFITNNKNVLIYLVLFLIIALGAFIRVQPFDKLIDSTTGKYISIELDSTVFLRYAEHIAENDVLYNIDKMRNYPVGVFIKDMGIFTSYFVAYTYRLFNLFIPNITVQYVDILYPVLATIIMTLYLFLFVRRVFNYKVALLCCLFINLLPSFLFRSLGGSSDHDILVMMFMVMAFYFYTVALQSKKLRNNILFGAIAGFTTFLSMYSGGAAQFVLLVIGVATLLEILFNKLEDPHFYTYFSWLAVFSIFIQVINLKAGILGHLNTLSTMPAYLAFGVALCHFFIIKRNLFNVNGYIKDKIPRGVTSVLLTFIFGSALFLILFGPNFFIDKFNQVISYVFHFYTSSRWALTVAENRTPYVVDWIGQFSLLYFLFMLLGIVALFYDSTKSLKIRNKLTFLFGLFIFIYVFSRYSPNSVFNGGSTLSRITFYGSIILFFLIIV